MNPPTLVVAPRTGFWKGILQLALYAALGCSSGHRNDAAQGPDSNQVGDAGPDRSAQNDSNQIGDAGPDHSARNDSNQIGDAGPDHSAQNDSTQVGDASIDNSAATVPWPATATSFWVQAQITRQGSGFCLGYEGDCPTQDTDTFLIRTEADQTIVIGARGTAYRVPVAQDSDGIWVTQSCPSPASSSNTLGPVVYDLCFAIGTNGFAGQWSGYYYTGYRYGPLRFRLTSSGLEGSAVGAVAFNFEDMGAWWSGPAQFIGVPDTEPPTLGAFDANGWTDRWGGGAQVDFHSQVLPLRASEPLPGTVTAWLVPSLGPTIPLDPIRTTFAPDLIVGFQPPANWATPNMSYTLGVDSFVDLAGNAGTANLRFTFVPATSPGDGGADAGASSDGGSEGDTAGNQPG